MRDADRDTEVARQAGLNKAMAARSTRCRDHRRSGPGLIWPFVLAQEVMGCAVVGHRRLHSLLLARAETPLSTPCRGPVGQAGRPDRSSRPTPTSLLLLALQIALEASQSLLPTTAGWPVALPFLLSIAGLDTRINSAQIARRICRLLSRFSPAAAVLTTPASQHGQAPLL